MFPDVVCVYAQENDVPPPPPPFIMLNAVSTTRLSTNRHRYTDDTQAIEQPVQVSVQVDFFGSIAQNMQSVFTTLWRDEYACQWFRSAGLPVSPLYSQDRQFGAWVNESDMFETRWTCEAQLQINQRTVLPADTANTLGPIGFIEVDTGLGVKPE